MARRGVSGRKGPKLVTVEGGGGMQQQSYGSNVSDETRREYLERGRMALIFAEEKRQEWRSANSIYRQVLKEAKKNGCTQVAWTLAMLKREPDDIAAEMKEQNRMLQIANIPVGVQLGLFEGAGETMAEVLERQRALQAAASKPVAEVIRDTWEKEDLAKSQGDAKSPESVTPPKPGPDDEEDEEDGEEEPEDEEEDQKAAGNEVLERSEEDQSAFLMGQRAFRLDRAETGNPYSSITSMHGAWIRGWKSEQAAKKLA